MLAFGFTAGFMLLRRVLLAMASMRSRNNGLQAIVFTPHHQNQDRPRVLTFSAHDQRSFSVEFSFTEPAMESSFPERQVLIDFGALAENLRNLSRSADPTMSIFRFNSNGGEFLMEMILDFNADTQDGIYIAGFGCVIIDRNQPIWRNPVVRRDYMVGAEVSAALLAQTLNLLRAEHGNVNYQLQISLGEEVVRISIAGPDAQFIMGVAEFFRNGQEIAIPHIVVITLHRSAMKAMTRIVRLAHQVWICADDTGRCVMQCTLPEGFGLMKMSFN